MTISKMLATTFGASGWDISKLSYSGKSYSVGGSIAAKGLFFKPDGTRMFVTGHVLNRVYQYDLTTPWDVSSVSTSASAAYDVFAGFNPAEGLAFKPDGTVFFAIKSGSSVGAIVSFTLSAPWDITTMSEEFSASASYDVKGLSFKEDGTKLIEVDGNQEKRFLESDLSTAWDVRTQSSPTVKSYTAQDHATGVFVRRDGRKLFTSDTQSSEIYEYNLSSPWSISTLASVQSRSVSSQDSDPNDLFFAPNGKRLYVLGGATNTVYQYDL